MLKDMKSKLKIMTLRGVKGDTVFYSANLTGKEITELEITQLPEYEAEGFDGIVLGIEGDGTMFNEVRIEMRDGNEYHGIGTLEFDGNEKVFCRKGAIPKIKVDESVPVIFVEYKK